MAKDLKKATTQAAKRGAEGVKNVAAEALAVGAVAAAGVVVSRAAEALGSGAKSVDQSNPTVQTAVHKALPGERKTAKPARKAKTARGSTRNKKSSPAKKAKRRKTRGARGRARR
jgi:hypothetical protein